MVTCKFCGTEVDPDNRLTFREVKGWEQIREQGGLNTLTLRHTTGEFACWSCVDKERRGIPAGQTSLV